MSGELNRDELRRRFEGLLDRALTGEDPPRGIDAEILSALEAEDAAGDTSETDRRCDSYTLWAAMTGLAQEVKLQGRAFKGLNEGIGAQAARVGDELRAVYRERERELEREVERRCRKDALSVLIDLRDRLARGIESVRVSEAEFAKAAKSGWLARLFSGPHDRHADQTSQALEKGYSLALERLDQALDESNARQILCQGQAFDPRRMNAVEREESAAVPAGTVLEVYRSGYEWNGEVFRPAQVKVSCAPPTGGARDE